MVLKRFAVFTAMATFLLVWMGGLVTSNGAGLSVPDWPNSYGYNMFLFPVSKWIGNIFYEHTHRLAASAVGLLTTVLALWLFGRKARPVLRFGGLLFAAAGAVLCWMFPAHAAENLLLAGVGLAAVAASFFWPACEPSAKWLRALGVIAFLAVVAQGVLGGLRVTQLKDQLGVFHAALGQLFFLLVSAIALFHTDFWRRLPVQATIDRHRFRPLLLVSAALILAQLVLGAAAVARHNQDRLEAAGENPITAFQIDLQMAHRIGALLVFVAVGVCLWRAWRYLGAWHTLTRFCAIWFGLVLTQVFLGAATIWTGKSADVATAHVACGALCLMTGGLASVVSFRLLAPAPRFVLAEKNTPARLPRPQIT